MAASINASPRKGELTGRHVLLYVLIGFAIVLAVNVAFIVLALRTFPGEDVRNPYEQGLQYNRTLAARERASALGLRAEAAFSHAADNAGVVIRLEREADTPVRGALMTGTIRRPTSDQFDQDLTFTEISDGVYRAPLPMLAPGQWDVRVNAAIDGEEFPLNARLTWP